MDMKLIGHKIKKAREAKGYTQEELAEKVNLSVQHVSVIERGKKAPKLETFIKIANELDVNADYLLADILAVSAKLTANELYEKIEKVPVKEQQRILKVVRVLVETAQG